MDRTRKYSLGDLMAIALCTVICGADTLEEVEVFGDAKANWLKTFLVLPNGVPSHDTFYRVFSRLDPQAFVKCVGDWLGAVCEAAGVPHVAIDGKACRSAPWGHSEVGRG